MIEHHDPMCVNPDTCHCMDERDPYKIISRLTAERDEAQAEVEQLRSQMDAWMRKRDRAYAERDAARAEVERLREPRRDTSSAPWMDGTDTDSRWSPGQGNAPEERGGTLPTNPKDPSHD